MSQWGEKTKELNPIPFLKVTNDGICGTIYSTESHNLPPPTANTRSNTHKHITRKHIRVRTHTQIHVKNTDKHDLIPEKPSELPVYTLLYPCSINCTISQMYFQGPNLIRYGHNKKRCKTRPRICTLFIRIAYFSPFVIYRMQTILNEWAEYDYHVCLHGGFVPGIKVTSVKRCSYSTQPVLSAGKSKVVEPHGG